MNKTINSKILYGVALVLAMATAALFPSASQAALKCQEIPDKRVCTDSAPRAVTLAPGQTVSVAAPIIDGYGTACWTWNRQFQCVEDTPVYACDSGTPYDTVKKDCSLVAAQINSTVTINAVRYITDADYTYRCAFGAWTSNETLPANKECVLLDSTTTQSNIVNAAAPGSSVTAPLDSQIALTETRSENYVCYSPPVTTCADKCFTEVYNATTKTMEKKEVACSKSPTNCTTASQQCTGSASTEGGLSADPNVGPDGRCVSSVQSFTCQAGDVPKCLSSANCTLSTTTPSGVQDNGFALNQEQTYICTNETTSCAEVANVSNCVHVGAWGWDQVSIKSQMGQGLGEVNAALSKVEGIQKGMKEDDPYIFSGQDLRCHYAVGNFLNTFITIALIAATAMATGGASIGVMGNALVSAGLTTGQAVAVQVGAAALADAPNSKAMGADCCKDFVFEGSDAWYKLGSCTADEIKLSVAKRKGLVHYLGEYCSKRSGFPVRQCVEKTRSYCVFDDMLALTVNEQGRAQLDALAMADATTTKATAAKAFSLYGAEVSPAPKYSGYLNTGRWTKLAQENNSQVWTWQYPNYCKSTAAQTAAYDIWMAEVMQATDTKGLQPSEVTQAQAIELIKKAINVMPFQECPSTPGTVSYLTCSKQDDTCDATKLPEGPTGVETDITGSDISQADVNWRVQQARSFFLPGDYGVTALMPTDSSFAAVTAGVNEFITAVGSCHATDGSCLYYFSITDKQATGGMGAKKRATEHVQFPLYTSSQTSAWPAVTYVKKDGTYDLGQYLADVNRGRADPVTVSNQRFIFHPNYIMTPPTGNLHSAVLVEYATEKLSASLPENDYTAMMVPTSIPPGTPGWSPYGDPTKHGKYFYISGGCDPNSRWCNYAIQVDLNIPRHPWGTAQSPHCWGFSLEQVAALDFDKMDLSRWINSLDLDTASASMSAEAAQAMTDQVTQSAQSFYSAVKTSQVINKPGAGTLALVTNTDVVPMLSNGNFKAYVLEAAVPTNWPNYFSDQPNTNPVTNVQVDWGDGSAKSVMTKHPEGRAYLSEHDYGDKPVGRYKVTVTLDTLSNGPQTLTTYVAVTPDSGKLPPPTKLDFSAPGANGKVQGQYNPAQTLNGLNQSPSSLQTISPGTTDQFNAQGASVTPPPKP